MKLTHNIPCIICHSYNNTLKQMPELNKNIELLAENNAKKFFKITNVEKKLKCSDKYLRIRIEKHIKEFGLKGWIYKTFLSFYIFGFNSAIRYYGRWNLFGGDLCAKCFIKYLETMNKRKPFG